MTVSEILQFVVQHGYWLIFASAFLEQIGLPLPAVPILLTMGALSRAGHLSFAASVLLAVIASLLADLIWYQLGRHRGRSVLSHLCRLSLEPDSCVRRTEDVFARQGGRTLLFSKFLPGLNTAAVPIAGMIGLGLSRFLLFDGAGTLLWAGAYSGTGYMFSNQLEPIARFLSGLGFWLFFLIGSVATVYILWKYAGRQRYLRQLQTARISPEELQRKLNVGEDLVIIDLRHKLEFEQDGTQIPGAVHMPPEGVEARLRELPRNREIILYCT